MKKSLALTAIMCIISACTTNEDATLIDLWNKNDYTKIRAAKVSEPPEVKIVEIPIDENMPIPEIPNPYKLQQEIQEVKTPIAEVYAIPASRAANKMLDDTRNIYEQNGNVFLYITSLKKDDNKIPDGTYKAELLTKKIIEGSNTFKVVSNKNEADYILETFIENIGSDEEPILEYKMILSDTENNKVKEWIETVRKVRNDDRSWW